MFARSSSLSIRFYIVLPLYFSLQMASGGCWNVTCICDNPAEFHCNTCGDILCSNCKAIHLRSQATGHHSIVAYADRVMPKHSSKLHCSKHKGQECNFWCEQCKEKVCSLCITSTHRGHDLADITSVLKAKRTLMQDDLKYLTSDYLKDWENLMEEASVLTATYTDEIDNVEKKMTSREVEFQLKMEDIFEENRDHLQEINTSNLAVLFKQEKDVSNVVQRIKQDAIDLERKLRDGEIDDLLNYDQGDVRVRKPLLRLSRVLPSDFSFGPIDEQALNKMFGSLAIQQACTKSVGLKQENTKAGDVKIDPSSPAAPNLSKEFQKVTPTLLSTFYVKRNAPCIVCIGQGQARIETNERTLHFVDEKGVLTDATNIDFSFNDMSLSQCRDIILSDEINQCIWSMSGDKIVKVLFKTPGKPNGLYCLPNGNIVVTFFKQKRVIVFSVSGKKIQTLDSEISKYPYRVCANKVNNDLCITEKQNLYINSPGTVLVLDSKYNFRYRYTGPDNKQLYPMDICTDTAGTVFVTDIQNDRVHILDKGGQFVQFLVAGQTIARGPCRIDVDDFGNAWIVLYGGEVQIIKYK